MSKNKNRPLKRGFTKPTTVKGDLGVRKAPKKALNKALKKERRVSERRVCLYGDGSWRLNSGERRHRVRRRSYLNSGIKSTAELAELEALDQQLDALTESASTSTPLTMGESAFGKQTSVSVSEHGDGSPPSSESGTQSSLQSTNTLNGNNDLRALHQSSGTEENNFTGGEANKSEQPYRNASITTPAFDPSKIESKAAKTAKILKQVEETKNGHTWDTLSADNNTPTNNNEITNEPNKLVDSEKSNAKTLGPEDQARLNSLKSMLDVSNARYKKATKNRAPVFVAGLKVKVTEGNHMGMVGMVLDADYIEDRCLMSLPDQETPKWVDFTSLGHAD